MDVEQLGYNNWFSDNAAPLLQPGQHVARVVAVNRNAFLVRDAERELPAELSGRFRFTIESSADLPCVGDWVMGVDRLETKVVSITGEGTHTTSRRQLLLHDNGAMLIDTPGMREFGLLGTSDGLDERFSELHVLSMDCRFADCTHTDEPGCAVLEAVKNDELSEDRYQSYIKLKKENEYHDMSYVEKRKKDKDFGRFIKTYKKQHRQ